MADLERIFFDTEFYENGETIEFISIGLVKENGDNLYLVNADFDYNISLLHKLITKYNTYNNANYKIFTKKLVTKLK
jgi:hypothetical protein